MITAGREQNADFHPLEPSDCTCSNLVAGSPMGVLPDYHAERSLVNRQIAMQFGTGATA
jgi:hypothetical protein